MQATLSYMGNINHNLIDIIGLARQDFESSSSLFGSTFR